MKVIFQGLDPSRFEHNTLSFSVDDKINNIQTLIKYLNENYKTDAFFRDNTLPPGALCIINGVDSCCGDGHITNNDEVVFINSLHGG